MLSINLWNILNDIAKLEQHGTTKEREIKNIARKVGIIDGDEGTVKGELIEGFGYQVRDEVLALEYYNNIPAVTWLIDGKDIIEGLNKKEIIKIYFDLGDVSKTTASKHINQAFNLLNELSLYTANKEGLVWEYKTIWDRLESDSMLYLFNDFYLRTNKTDLQLADIEDLFYKIYNRDSETVREMLRFVAEDTKLISVDLNQGLSNIFINSLIDANYFNLLPVQEVQETKEVQETIELSKVACEVLEVQLSEKTVAKVAKDRIDFLNVKSGKPTTRPVIFEQYDSYRHLKKGYKDTRKAIANHCKHTAVLSNIFKRGVLPPLKEALNLGNSWKQTKMISQYDIIRLVMKSKLPSAERFENLESQLNKTQNSFNLYVERINSYTREMNQYIEYLKTGRFTQPQQPNFN